MIGYIHRVTHTVGCTLGFMISYILSYKNWIQTKPFKDCCTMFIRAVHIVPINFGGYYVLYPQTFAGYNA